MKRWKFLVGVLAIVAIGAVAWHAYAGGQAKGPSYRLVTVEKGDIESLVSTTGTLNPVTTVKVGTQVSGIISAIYVDFNDKVRKGELIARLDTTLLRIAVRDAQAKLAHSQADFDNATREYNRTKGLYTTGMVSESDYNQAQYQRDVTRADLQSAEINLERARENLSYATIYAPISGTVIERDVDIGQTVASSLSAPQLFLIGNDLSRMEILASVDESDIGRIHNGQTVRFTVQAYADDTFIGTVRQVRMQSTVDEHVVDYTVAVSVDNRDGKLLPGMTATTNFLIERQSNVFKVLNAALRFRATDAMRAQLRASRAQNRPEGGQADSTGRPRPLASRSGEPRKGMQMLWYVDASGKLNAMPVRAGITDGQYTAIQGRDLTEGMNVIAGITENASTTASSSPFQAPRQQQGGPPRPPGG